MSRSIVQMTEPTTGPADRAKLFIPKDWECIEYIEKIRCLNLSTALETGIAGEG